MDFGARRTVEESSRRADIIGSGGSLSETPGCSFHLCTCPRDRATIGFPLPIPSQVLAPLIRTVLRSFSRLPGRTSRGTNPRSNCLSQSISGFLPNNQLPPRHEIEALCLKANLYGRGIAVHKSSEGPIVAWVKYGVYVTVAEALTQDWVARVLAADPNAVVHTPRVFDAFMIPRTHFNIGVIVMEYVKLPDCDQSDSKLVAEAVQRLHGIEAPSPAPGPVGGGPAVHPFFVDWDSRITYKSVEELKSMSMA